MPDHQSHPQLKLGRSTRSRRHEALHAARKWLEAEAQREPAGSDLSAVDQAFATWPAASVKADGAAAETVGQATADIVDQLDLQLRQLEEQRRHLSALLGQVSE